MSNKHGVFRWHKSHPGGRCVGCSSDFFLPVFTHLEVDYLPPRCHLSYGVDRFVCLWAHGLVENNRFVWVGNEGMGKGFGFMIYILFL